MTHRLSRRRLLEYGSAASIVLAGCTGNGGDEGTEQTATASPTDTATPTDADTPTDEQSTSSPSVGLTVNDQELSNRTVVVSRARLDGSGWLVVHPEATGGGPNGGVVLAKRQLSAGTYENVELTLDVVTTEGATVYAMLHYDDPADGRFTFPQNGDPPITRGGSPVVQPLSATLTADVTPALSTTDQQTDGSTITVPSSAIDKRGWLVVHPEAADGGPNGGVVLAKKRLVPGLYADQTLSLSSTLSTDQTLYGMLHYDDPMDGQFTFPQNGDPPVTTDGSPIVQPFAVTVRGGGRTVTAADISFEPQQLSISPGTSVTWVNEDSVAHDVTSAAFHDSAADWDLSRSLAGDGGRTTYTFDEPGIYEYYCSIHGQNTMCGAVLVGDVSLDGSLPCADDDGSGGGDGGGYGY